MSMPTSFLHEAKSSVASSSETISFNVISRPLGLLVACQSKEAYAETPWTILTVSAIYSDYQGGAYFGGRFNAIRYADNLQDNWQITNTGFAYDDNTKTFTITKSSSYYGRFASDREYYMWYII